MERGGHNSWCSVSPTEANAEAQNQFSMISSSSDGNTNLKQEPTSSPFQNVSIPDCPTPDSVHSGADSSTACSISSLSPAVTSEMPKDESKIISTSWTPNFTNNDALYTMQHKNEPTSHYSSSPFFNAILSKTSSMQDQGLNNSNITPFYGAENGDGNACSKSTSLRSKG